MKLTITWANHSKNRISNIATGVWLLIISRYVNLKIGNGFMIRPRCYVLHRRAEYQGESDASLTDVAIAAHNVIDRNRFFRGV